MHSLLRKLGKKPNDLIKYNAIIQEQLKDGVIDYAPNKPTGKRIFYMLHRAVIKEDSETTKTRIVFDASAKEYGSPSLNDCLHIGPPLQPLLLNVILQNRLQPVCLTGDIKQAFLQIRVDNKDRDVFRFYWISDLKSKEVITLRFTRIPFGCASSPFNLGGVIKQHLLTYEKHYPHEKNEIHIINKGKYVVGIITRGVDLECVKKLKQTAIHLFKKGGFQLHKWHSNFPVLETNDAKENYHEVTINEQNKRYLKILGLLWDKNEDTLLVDCRPTRQTSITLITGHMVANALTNVKLALEGHQLWRYTAGLIVQ